MKKLLLSLILLLGLVSLTQAQQVGLTYGPFKNAIGIVYVQDSLISSNISFVVSTDLGAYVNQTGIYYSRVPIWKFGTGLKYKWFTALYQYNKLYNIEDEIGYFKISDVKIHSLELGCIKGFSKKLGIIMLYDVINAESRVGITFKF